MRKRLSCSSPDCHVVEYNCHSYVATVNMFLLQPVGILDRDCDACVFPFRTCYIAILSMRVICSII